MWDDHVLAACRVELNDAVVALEKLLTTVEGAETPVRPGDVQSLRAFLVGVDLWERVTVDVIGEISAAARSSGVNVWGRGHLAPVPSSTKGDVARDGPR